MAQNVLGGELVPCSLDPLTGFYRNGCCDTGGDDLGVHVVCARVTAEFLAFSKAAGNVRVDVATTIAATQSFEILLNRRGGAEAVIEICTGILRNSAVSRAFANQVAETHPQLVRAVVSQV